MPSLSVSAAAAAVKSLQSCLTLCDPTDGSPPGSPVPGILQARTLEWVAISFSSAGKWKVKVKSLSRVWLFVTPWTAAHQAPPFMGFSRQEYWSGVPSPSPSVSLHLLFFVECRKGTFGRRGKPALEDTGRDLCEQWAGRWPSTSQGGEGGGDGRRKITSGRKQWPPEGNAAERP